MTECQFQSRLSAFHDRELDPEVAWRLERHLPECQSCRETLAGIRAVSRLMNEPLGERMSDRMSQMGLARLHATADAAAAAGRREVFPLAKTMMAIAASILIIAGAWLAEIPPTTASGPSVVIHSRPEAEWEKVASGSKWDRPQGLRDNTGMATNWMVDSLKTDVKP